MANPKPDGISILTRRNAKFVAPFGNGIFSHPIFPLYVADSARSPSFPQCENAAANTPAPSRNESQRRFRGPVHHQQLQPPDFPLCVADSARSPLFPRCANAAAAPTAVDQGDLEGWIARALAEAAARGVTGKDATPFLLARLAEASNGRTLVANVARLEHNARLAGRIAAAYAKMMAG